MELALSLQADNWRDTLRAEWLWQGECALRLNEIMPDPGGWGPEWLELINSHAQLPLNLRGVLLDDNCNGEPVLITAADYFLLPGDMIVITGDREAMEAAWGTVPLCEMSRAPRLGNSGDCLALLAPGGTMLEQLQWDGSWLTEAGYSLERYNPQLPNGPEAWSRCLATTGGTPGACNSIRLEELPRAVSHTISSDLLTPDGDGINEVLVITLQETAYHVQLRVRVFNLIGICVRHLESGPHGAAVTRVLWNGRDDDGCLLPPGAYVVLTETAGAGNTHSSANRHAVALYY